MSEISVSQDLREREDDIIWRLRLTDDRPGKKRERWFYVDAVLFYIIEFLYNF